MPITRSEQFLILQLLFAIIFSLQLEAQNQFSYSSTTTWQELSRYAPELPINADKTIWAGLITLRSRNPLKLNQFSLQWQGSKVETLYASLYTCPKKGPILPISQYLICDGSWDNKKQRISFQINEKIIANKKYYLILNIENKNEERLKSGNFQLMPPTAMPQKEKS